MKSTPTMSWTPAQVESELASLLAQAHGDPVDALRRLVDLVRPSAGPAAAARAAQAELRLRGLLHLLQNRPDLARALKQAVRALVADRHAVLLFATSGIYPDTGVLSETVRRLSHKLLPEAQEPQQLQSVVGMVFRRDDAAWLADLPHALWLALLQALVPMEAGAGDGHGPGTGRLGTDLLEAIRVVAHRIAAAGLEPEMLRLEPALEQHASPFLALCDEALAFARVLGHAADAAAAAPDPDAAQDHHRHLLVLIDQCRASIERVRRTAQREGASFHLTFRLRRLSQHLQRLQVLVELHCTWDGSDAVAQRSAALLRELVLAECQRNDLRRFWRQNTELVALRVAENAGRSGEHYITSTRAQYLAMLRAAAGGGFVVACMAMVKVLTAAAGLPPLTEVLVNCLNYGLGFVLVHLLHLAVATKQPAMTANAIAAALDPPRGSADSARESRERSGALVQLVARTVRTQLAAVLGNIAVALPTAAAMAGLVFWATGAHFVAPAKAVGLLEGLNPLASGALVYAAVAGVCLFLAGLIAGFYDNLCAYNRIPQRLLQLRAPARWLGLARWQRVAAYVENNLGALVGNFSLGFLLGGAAGLGSLLGWPLDVRHVTLTSANWGFAMTALNGDAPWQLAVLAAVGVGLIGAVNLGVSFSLALWIALKSRGITFQQGRSLLGEIVRGFRQRPREFFLPPRDDVAAAEAAPSSATSADANGQGADDRRR